LAYQFAWQWPQAEKEYQRALSLNDNYPGAHHWFGVYLYITRQLDSSEREIRRAQELDPLSQIISANLAIIFLLRNDTDAAFAQCQKIIQLDPNHISGHDWLGWTYVKQGRYPEAIAEREKVAELSQGSGPQLGGLGYVYALSGRRAEALAILKDLEEKYARGETIGQHVAAIYYGLGDKDQAFAWLEKDFAAHSAELQHIMERVQFEQIRSEPRGIDLIRRMGLNP
jgi:Flp pilus assembly protein TadD